MGRGRTVVLWCAALSAAAVLTACGTSSETGTRGMLRPVLLAGGTATFEPAEPAGSRVLTAQEAYNALLRQAHRPPKPIPAFLHMQYGYLTQSDTAPPADHMAVWALNWTIGCLNTGTATTTPHCLHWSFVRASDGKDLGVDDQQSVS